MVNIRICRRDYKEKIYKSSLIHIYLYKILCYIELWLYKTCIMVICPGYYNAMTALTTNIMLPKAHIFHHTTYIIYIVYILYNIYIK